VSSAIGSSATVNILATLKEHEPENFLLLELRSAKAANSVRNYIRPGTEKPAPSIFVKEPAGIFE
jgi:hypothetical protein